MTIPNKMAIKIGKDHTSSKMSEDLGVELYMPPEYKSHGVYTKKSDVYSAGIIFFELLNYFSTDMERINALSKVTSGQYVFNQEEHMIDKMIGMDPSSRPEISEIHVL